MAGIMEMLVRKAVEEMGSPPRSVIAGLRKLPDDILEIGVAAYDNGGDSAHMSPQHCLSVAWEAMIDALCAREISNTGALPIELCGVRTVIDGPGLSKATGFSTMQSGFSKMQMRHGALLDALNRIAAERVMHVTHGGDVLLVPTGAATIALRAVKKDAEYGGQ
jgi:hypothetical protein